MTVTIPAATTVATDDVGRLVVSCEDRPGIVANISSFLFRNGANIIQSDQCSTGQRFFMRVEFHLPRLAERRRRLEPGINELAARLHANIHLRSAATPTRVAVFVSRQDHCLLDVLWRARRRELPIDVVRVVSNHPDLEPDAASFGVPFSHVPVTAATKPRAEQQQLDLLRDRVDLVVLARYMQILSGDFLARVGVPVINIHHSFLPAFAGARPYEQARARGVKLIGATAHYATEDLDEGPIIEQDVLRVNHRAGAADLARAGADIERTVLSRAIAWHCADRVLLDGGTTIVF